MSRVRFRWALGSVAVLAAVLLAGSVLFWQRDSPPDRTVEQYTVTASGTSLELDGAPWWPTGFNAYQLATDWSLNAGCGAQVDLDAYFGALPPRTLTRFSLFAPFTVRVDDGTIDYRAADAVFDAAARHGQLLLPVLASGDGACDGEEFKDRQWYSSGWRTAPASAHGSYESWVRAAVDRWKDAPALAGWTAVGEPETSSCTGSACGHWRTRSCLPGAGGALRQFFDDVGALIDSIDGHHLLFAGLVGGGQCGTAANDFALVGASPGIDVLEYHDYTLDEPAAPADSVPARAAQSAALNKPLLVGEVGQKAGSCLPPAERAIALRAAIAGYRVAGAAGALGWSFVPDPRPDECTYDIGPGDPLWPRLEDPGPP